MRLEGQTGVVVGGRAAVVAAMMPIPTPVRRPPVPPMNSRVPAGGIRGAAWRATASITIGCS